MSLATYSFLLTEKHVTEVKFKIVNTLHAGILFILTIRRRWSLIYDY
jgi:hypothetical protein